jgi:hypothetical protein
LGTPTKGNPLPPNPPKTVSEQSEYIRRIHVLQKLQTVQLRGTISIKKLLSVLQDFFQGKIVLILHILFITSSYSFLILRVMTNC